MELPFHEIFLAAFKTDVFAGKKDRRPSARSGKDPRTATRGIELCVDFVDLVTINRPQQVL
jgi:hypothetical protein